MNIKLYDIPVEWQKILAILEESCGELTPELETAAQELISASKEKLEAAGLAKRNLELHAAMASAQAKVFMEEAAKCTAISKAFESSADRLGALMAPALQITGNVKTVAGTLYTRTNTTWSFEMKPGAQFYELPEPADLPEALRSVGPLWRQKDPELNKTALKKLAEANALPVQILAAKAENTTVCLKAPSGKKDAEADVPATAA